MRVFELKSDGQLSRNIIDEIGDEYNIKERLESKIYGLGHLRYTTGNLVLDEFYERHNHAIKTHFDWTKKGAVIRLRTMDKQFAIGLSEGGFKGIKLSKQPDYIYAMPFMPFWTLLKLGTPFKFAKWFRLNGDRFNEGKCELTIKHDDTSMTFELAGDLWSDCLSTFIIERAKHILSIQDKRTWITDNGFKVNSGTTTNTELYS